jgi:hypothetical protein
MSIMWIDKSPACKYREFVCNFCQRLGHLERVCRNKQKGKKITKRVHTLQLKHVTQRQQRKPGPTKYRIFFCFYPYKAYSFYCYQLVNTTRLLSFFFFFIITLNLLENIQWISSIHETIGKTLIVLFRSGVCLSSECNKLAIDEEQRKIDSFTV